MVADGVEAIASRRDQRVCAVGDRRHLFVEDAVAERLRAPHLRRRGREPHFQVAETPSERSLGRARRRPPRPMAGIRASGERWRDPRQSAATRRVLSAWRRDDSELCFRHRRDSASWPRLLHGAWTIAGTVTRRRGLPASAHAAAASSSGRAR